mmetsp:Transcript_1820/g.5708  ORF Transcript_1820/g.5708 Transcript_1820/m.5708 type:complete len:200 (+) Transcript_1820:375-974(+)
MFGNLVLVVWPPPDSNVPPCSSASIRREKAGFITEWWKSWMTQAPCRPPSSELRAAVSAAYSSKTASERGPCLTDPIHLCVTLHVSPQTSRRFMSASNRFSALSHCRCRYFLTASMISSAHNSRNGTMGRSSHQSGVNCLRDFQNSMDWVFTVPNICSNVSLSNAFAPQPPRLLLCGRTRSEVRMNRAPEAETSSGSTL